MSTVIRTTGIEATLRALTDKKRDTVKAVNEGLHLVARMILNRALYLCPVETGAMRATGEVGEPTGTGVGLGTRTSVSFGGQSAPYTIFVHENLNASHLAPTIAKWLEVAVMQTRGPATRVLERAFKYQIVSHEEGAADRFVRGSKGFRTATDRRAGPAPRRGR